MDISYYQYVYPVVHDMSPVRSTTFHKIDYSEISLLNASSKRLLPPDFYGLFHDDRGNLFLGLTKIIKAYNLLLSYNNNSYYINCTYYDEVKHLFEWGPPNTLGIFQFLGSEPLTDNDPSRCDIGRINAPSTFLRPGQIAAGVGNALLPVSKSDIEAVYVLLSVDGVGHIVYAKYFAGKNDSNENFVLNESDLPAASRSIFPLLKLMLEWSSMVDDPWNSVENIAVASNEFFKKLQIPDVVKESIQLHGPMHIYRYLRGDTDARRQPDVSELEPLTDHVKAWLKTKMLYHNVAMFYRALTS